MAIMRLPSRTLLSSILLVFFFSVYANSTASAQTDGNPPLSGEDIAKAKRIALADERVQNYVAGRPYYVMSYGSSTNDNEPGVVRPTLLYNIDNRDQLSVTVDLQTGTVKDVLYYPDFMVTSHPQETVESASVASSWYWIIIVIAGIGASAAIAAVYLKSKRERNIGSRISPN